MADSLTRAMEAVMRASAATTDWRVQRMLLAAYDALAVARRESLMHSHGGNT